MTLTYKNDSSFFIYVKAPGSYIGIKEIAKWFESNTVSRYRLIIDDELDSNYATIQQVDEYYPGVKSIGMVINPWARPVIAYNDLQNMDHHLTSIASGTFTEFINNLLKLKEANVPYNPLSPQVDWVEYTDNNGIFHTADYIFKCENLNEEFKIIQSYFENYTPLEWFHSIPEYRSYYTDETKQIIAELFKKDIERFNYEF
jgi:hypothetical protein